MNKLLNKPFKVFSLYALIILACSIPVYYLVISNLWIEELDEYNLIIKERIKNRFDKIQIEETELNKTLALWKILQPGTSIIPSNISTVKADSVYTITKQNEYAEGNEMDRFRGLSSYIVINDTPYHFIIETNVEDAEGIISSIAFVTLLFFILLIVGFVFLNKIIAGKIWSPFKDTLAKLKLFDLNSHPSILFEKTDILEFEELNNALTKLIHGNIAVYKQQKNFTENASHELQTPIAVLKSKVDMLLQNESISHKQLEIINSINIHLSRVSRINKNLLLLSKIENHHFTESETLDLNELLNENIELLSDYFKEKGIIIEKKINEKHLIVCNKTLLEIMLNNLLINAIRHNILNGKIIITLNNNTLSISNSGITTLNKETIFKRFAVSSSETTGSGLGLAIVKEIGSRYQWQITYSFQNNLHIFSIIF